MRFPVGPFQYVVEICPERPLSNDGFPTDGIIDYDTLSIRIYHGLNPQRRLNTLLHELWHGKRNHLGVNTDEEADCDAAAAFMQQVMQELEQQGGLAVLAAMKPAGLQWDAEEPALADGCDHDAHDDGDGDGGEHDDHDDEGGYQLVDIGDEFPEDPADVWGDDEQRSRPESRMGGSTTADCCTKSCGREFFASDVWTGPTEWCNAVNGRVVSGVVVRRELFCPSCGHLQVWLEGWDPVRGLPNGVVVALLGVTTDPDRISEFWKKLGEQCMGGLRPSTDVEVIAL